MAVNRVQVTWSGGAAAGGGLSTFYFNSTVGTAAQQVAAVNAFLTATDDRRTTALGWTILGDVATLNVGTGDLEAMTATTSTTGTGTAAGDALPPIAQGLLRLLTSQIVGGRLLRGRLFLPGAVEGDNASTGGTSATFKSDYDAAAATLIAAANAEWSVWSQTHGVLANVDSANTWSKFASLRSRRD